MMGPQEKLQSEVGANYESLAQLYQAARDENELLEFKNYELMFKIQELEQQTKSNREQQLDYRIDIHQNLHLPDAGRGTPTTNGPTSDKSDRSAGEEAGCIVAGAMDELTADQSQVSLEESAVQQVAGESARPSHNSEANPSPNPTPMSMPMPMDHLGHEMSAMLSLRNDRLAQLGALHDTNATADNNSDSLSEYNARCVVEDSDLASAADKSHAKSALVEHHLNAAHNWPTSMQQVGGCSKSKVAQLDGTTFGESELESINSSSTVDFQTDSSNKSPPEMSSPLKSAPKTAPAAPRHAKIAVPVSSKNQIKVNHLRVRSESNLDLSACGKANSFRMKTAPDQQQLRQMKPIAPKKVQPVARQQSGGIYSRKSRPLSQPASCGKLAGARQTPTDAFVTQIPTLISQSHATKSRPLSLGAAGAAIDWQFSAGNKRKTALLHQSSNESDPKPGGEPSKHSSTTNAASKSLSTSLRSKSMLNLQQQQQQQSAQQVADDGSLSIQKQQQQVHQPALPVSHSDLPKAPSCVLLSQANDSLRSAVQTPTNEASLDLDCKTEQCQQCKVLQSKLDLLNLDRLQLNDQINELEELENDSRLMSQKLEQKLIVVQQQFDCCRNDLRRAKDCEFRLHFQNKRLSFEIRQKHETIQHLQCQLSKLQTRSSLSAAAAANEAAQRSAEVAKCKKVDEDDPKQPASMNQSEMDSAYSKSSASSDSQSDDGHRSDSSSGKDCPSQVVATVVVVSSSSPSSGDESDHHVAPVAGGQSEQQLLLPVHSNQLNRQQVVRKKISTARILRGIQVGQQQAVCPGTGGKQLAARKPAPLVNQARLVPVDHCGSSDETKSVSPGPAPSPAGDDNGKDRRRAKTPIELAMEAVKNLDKIESEVCELLTKCEGGSTGKTLSNGKVMQTSTSEMDDANQTTTQCDSTASYDGQLLMEGRLNDGLKQEILGLRTRLAQANTLNDNLVTKLQSNKKQIDQLQICLRQQQQQVAVPTFGQMSDGNQKIAGSKSNGLLVGSTGSRANNQQLELAAQQQVKRKSIIYISGAQSGSCNLINSNNNQDATTAANNAVPYYSQRAGDGFVAPTGESSSLATGETAATLQQVPVTIYSTAPSSSSSSSSSSACTECRLAANRFSANEFVSYLKYLLDKIHYHNGRTFELVNECQKLAMNALMASYNHQINQAYHSSVVVAGNQAAAVANLNRFVNRPAPSDGQTVTIKQQQQVRDLYPVKPPPRRRSTDRPSSSDCLNNQPNIVPKSIHHSKQLDIDKSQVVVDPEPITSCLSDLPSNNLNLIHVNSAPAIMSQSQQVFHYHNSDQVSHERYRVIFNRQLLDLVTRHNLCESIIAEKIKSFNTVEVTSQSAITITNNQFYSMSYS